MRRAVLIVVAVASCSKPAELKCGTGTVLKDGQCVVATGAAQAPQQFGSGSAVVAKSGSAVESGSAVPMEGSATVPNGSGSAAGDTDLGWIFTTERDKMRGKNIFFARLVSTDYQVAVQLRKGEPGSGFDTDAMLQLSREQFECGIEGCAYALKFDDEPVSQWAMRASQGFNTKVLFFGDAQRFIAKLRKAHQLIVEVNLFQHGRHQFTFHVSSLEGWEPLKASDAAEKAASAIEGNIVYCFDVKGDTEPFRVCGESQNACAKGQATDRRVLPGADVGACRKISPPPCKPEPGKFCNFKITADGTNAGMEGFVEKPQRASGYCFDNGGSTSCGRTLDDCKQYMQAKAVTDATCKRVAKAPCSFDAGDPYCDSAE